MTVRLARGRGDRMTLKAYWLAGLAVSVGLRPLRGPVLQWEHRAILSNRYSERRV